MADTRIRTIDQTMLFAVALATALFVAPGCAADIEDDEWESDPDNATGEVLDEVRGGTNTSAKSWLGSVQLKAGGDWNHVCAVTLIRKRWVLTAAHCAKALSKSAIAAGKVRVCMGIKNIDDCPSSKRAIVTKKKIHPDYKSTGKGWDAAVLKLDEGFNGQRVTLAKGSQDPDGGQETRLRGWGLLQNGNAPNSLKSLEYDVYANDLCDYWWDLHANRTIYGRQLCTLATSQEGACNGDSGGPLHFQGRQVGIVSYGAANCTGGLPDVYTRISSIRGWALNTTK